MDRCELAYTCFQEGCNCAQSVICAFADKLNLPKETCMAMACGFGGGVGGSRVELCGAVSGGVLVLNLLHPHTSGADAEGKKAVYSLVKSFRERFQEALGNTRCRELLDSGLTATERTPAASRLGLTRCCDIAVVTAVEILEEMLGE